MSLLKRSLRKTYSYLFHRDNEPSLLIIGAQKSGTSSLHYYLSQHPDMAGSRPKEVGFFHRDIYFGKTFSDYKTHFRGPKSKIYFESTPEYLIHPGVAENIHKYLPQVRMVVLMRDPVSRAYSAWNHYRELFETGRYVKAIGQKFIRDGNLAYDKLFNGRKSFPSFRECIDIELEIIRTNAGFEPALLRRGLYLDQLKVYWEFFPKERFKYIGFRDLTDCPVNVLNEVTRFAGAKEISWKHLKFEPKNSRQYQEPIKDEDRLFLERFYKAANEALFAALGKINW